MSSLLFNHRNQNDSAFKATSNTEQNQPWTLDRIKQAAGIERVFTTQVQLFEYIEQENQRILSGVAKKRYQHHHHQNNYSNSNNNNYTSNRRNYYNNSNNNNNNNADIFSSSASSVSSSQFFDRRENQHSQLQQSVGGGAGGGGMKEELLRPFCIHIDSEAAKIHQQQQQQYFASNSNSPGAKMKSLQQQQLSALPRNQNQYSSSSSSSSSSVNRSQEHQKAQEEEASDRVLSLFANAEKCGAHKLPTRRSNRNDNKKNNDVAGDNEQAGRVPPLSSITNTNNNVNKNQEVKQEKEGGENNTTASKKSEEVQCQTRFFVALTQSQFSRIARLDLKPQFIPHLEQHFFEIIQENSPCVLYFDVEMEPIMALTKTEHEDLKKQVEAFSAMRLFSATSAASSASSSSQNLLHQIPKELRIKHKCCSVDCEVAFNHKLTRDVLVDELKKFMNEHLQLPLNSFSTATSTSTTSVSSSSNTSKNPLSAKVDDSCFFVLISNSPTHIKFSQHYIVRFTDDTVRFANNMDAKTVIVWFVNYLYERAAVDQRVHSALFYHETVQRKRCTVTVPSSSSWSSSSSSSNSNSSQNQNQKVGQDDTSSNFDVADYTVPAISLKCIIDEAVYSRNRMMRCYGSCKAGKKAILTFDEEWLAGRGNLSNMRFSDTSTSSSSYSQSQSSSSSVLASFQDPNQDNNNNSNNNNNPCNNNSNNNDLFSSSAFLSSSNYSSSSSSSATVVGGIVGATLISEPLLLAQQRPDTFRFVDSETLSRMALASGNVSYAPSLQQQQQQLIHGTSTAPVIITKNQNSSSGNHAQFQAQHETSTYNSAAATLKFPCVCEEVLTVQGQLERKGLVGTTSSSAQIEQIQVHVPKTTVNMNDVHNTSPGKNNNNSSSSTNSSSLQLTMNIKIRGSRFCNVVKRQHRSNQVYWVLRFYAKKVYSGGSGYRRQGEDQNDDENDNSVSYTNHVVYLEQRCFDDECKGQRRFTKEDVAESVITELKLFTGTGFSSKSYVKAEDLNSSSGKSKKDKFADNNERALASAVAALRRSSSAGSLSSSSSSSSSSSGSLAGSASPHRTNQNQNQNQQQKPQQQQHSPSAPTSRKKITKWNDLPQHQQQQQQEEVKEKVKENEKESENGGEERTDDDLEQGPPTF